MPFFRFLTMLNFKDRYKNLVDSPVIKMGGREIMTVDKVADIAPVSDVAENSEFVFTISTNNIDRCNDIMIPSGALLDNYKRNPVVLSQHRSYEYPFGRTTDIQVTPTGLVATAKFHDYTDEAKLIIKLLNGGYLNAASIGFAPLEWIDRTPAEGELIHPTDDMQVREYTKWDLYEWSVVTIPANGYAVRPAKNIDDAVSKNIIPENHPIVIEIKKKSKIPKIIISQKRN